MPIVKGKCRWARTTESYNRVGDYDCDPRYSIAVEVDKAWVKDVHKANGVKQSVKEDDDGRLWFEFRKKAVSADGKAIPAPKVVDAKMQAIPADVLIGNDSTVAVQYSLYEYNGKMGKGVKLSLEAVQVIDLVPYKRDVKLEFNQEEGFAVEDNSDLEFNNSDDVDASIDAASKEM